MGIYVIRRDILIELLQEQLPKANDFGTEVLQGAIALGMKVGTFLFQLTDLFHCCNIILLFMDQVHAYMFDGHWNDLRNIEAFYQVNIESITRSMSTKLVLLLTEQENSFSFISLFCSADKLVLVAASMAGILQSTHCQIICHQLQYPMLS